MGFWSIVLLIIIIAIILDGVDWIRDWIGKQIEKVKEWFKDDGRTITTEERMKRYEAEKEFMRKHPNVKC